MHEVKLKDKTVDVGRLEQFGFVKAVEGYCYEKKICGGELLMTLKFLHGKIFSSVTDSAGEEYTLHLVESSVGSYVGAIREEYEKTLAAFVESCCKENIFCAKLTADLIEYVREKYGEELEFLWAKFPKNAIWRRRDTQKWYAVILSVNEKKLGLDSDKDVEVIDLRGEPDELKELVDGVNYFAGYHMNKKSWFTIRLDGSVDFEKICAYLDKSYTLAVK